MSTEVVPPVDMHEEEYEGRLVLVSRNPLGVGVGKASAEIESFDEALELSRKLAESVEATNVESTDCGDGREFAVSGHRLLTLAHDSPESVVSPSLFGGSANAALGMRLLAEKLPRRDMGYATEYDRISKELTDSGIEIVGAHIDTHTRLDGEASNCGSLDKAQAVYAAAGDPEIAAALQPFVKFVTEAMGSEFDEEKYWNHSSNAAEVADSAMFDGWHGVKAVKTTLALGGLVRVLEGGEHTDAAHNHRESLTAIILSDNEGLNKQKFTEATGLQAFAVTPKRLRHKAEIIAREVSGQAMDEAVNDLVQAGVLFQLAHAIVVPDGTQYLTVVK